MKKLLSVLALSSLLLVSCSKSSDSTSTGDNNNNNGNGGAATNQVVATINGTKMTFKTGSSSGSYANGLTSFAIVGVDSATGNTITVAGGGYNLTKGTYDIGIVNPPSTLFALGYEFNDANNNDVKYSSDATKQTKTGTITISSLSSTNAQGTFSGTIPLSNGPSGAASTIAITSGGFNVNF